MRIATILFIAAALPAAARDIQLALPLDCALGETCYIQQFRDMTPGPGVSDFACGDLSYDGHKGTDFALPSLKAMEAGVNVLASAPGTVRGTRDGEEDGAFLKGADLGGKDCGNGVTVEHGGGWQTQYCHLRKGSVIVRTGDRVAAGTPLGLVGLSGRSQFPHAHITVRKDGTDIDPFHPQSATTCDLVPDGSLTHGLWRSDIPYLPAGLIEIGFGVEPPEYDDVKAGIMPQDIPAGAPQLVLWSYGWGQRPGDTLKFAITGPSGFTFENTVDIDKARALSFYFTGKKARNGLVTGRYTGTVTLSRDGKQLSVKTVALDTK